MHNKSNLVYRAIVDYINSLQADRHDIAHAITLMCAQMPNAGPTMIQIFLHAEGLEMETNGEQLPRLEGMIDPHSVIHIGEVLSPMKNTTARMPESDAERPLVQMWIHPHIEDGYGADRHNMKTLCSFHEVLPPQQEDFEKHNSDELVIRLGYGHVNGGFHIHFFPSGEAYVQLLGEFTIDSFIPVRVEIIKQPDNTP